MDRETRDPLALCEEVGACFGIDTCAGNWPIGFGKGFQGAMAAGGCMAGGVPAQAQPRSGDGGVHGGIRNQNKKEKLSENLERSKAICG